MSEREQPADGPNAGVRSSVEESERPSPLDADAILPADGRAAEPVEPVDSRLARAESERALRDPDADLPVVARLVVEVRSDGRRTVARGAIEDVSGTSVAVQARGDSPWQLAWALARSIFSAPSLVSRTGRKLLPGRRKRGRKRGAGDDQ